jgi:hypothetical protein
MYDEELKDYMDYEGYLLRPSSDERHLELFEFGGGYRTTIAYWEASTGNTFDCVEDAFKWVYNL